VLRGCSIRNSAIPRAPVSILIADPAILRSLGRASPSRDCLDDDEIPKGPRGRRFAKYRQRRWSTLGFTRLARRGIFCKLARTLTHDAIVFN